jgi:hypothetical protein
VCIDSKCKLDPDRLRASHKWIKRPARQRFARSMKWEALSAAQGTRTSRASWPSSWAGHRRRTHAALQPTASAAHGPKLHSHGPLTSFRCRFVCGITSQKKSYQTCPAAFGLGGLEQHLWGETGAMVSACMQGRTSAAVSPHQGGDRTRSRPNLACAAARARPRRRAASRTCGRVIKFNQV